MADTVNSKQLPNYQMRQVTVEEIFQKVPKGALFFVKYQRNEPVVCIRKGNKFHVMLGPRAVAKEPYCKVSKANNVFVKIEVNENNQEESSNEAKS